MNYIVDDIEKVVALMRSSFDSSFTFEKKQWPNGAPFYLYGHRQEINDRLLKKDGDGGSKRQKYPLIALRLDTTEKVENGYQAYNLNIAILAFTDSNFNAEQRYEKVFKPLLYPLYELFFKKLDDSGLFTWDANDMEMPSHTKIDRPYWGTNASEANVANIFSDPLDAIEILDLKLLSRISCRL